MPMKQARLAAPETRQFYLKTDTDQQEKPGFFVDTFISTGKHPYCQTRSQAKYQVSALSATEMLEGNVSDILRDMTLLDFALHLASQRF